MVLFIHRNVAVDLLHSYLKLRRVCGRDTPCEPLDDALLLIQDRYAYDEVIFDPAVELAGPLSLLQIAHPGFDFFVGVPDVVGDLAFPDHFAITIRWKDQ